MPPKFDVTAPIEDEFLTPPIWVASNPPPVFERPEMKRTMSEVSNWDGDDEEEDDITSPDQKDAEEEEEVTKENVRFKNSSVLIIVTTTHKVTGSKSTDVLELY